MKAMRVIVSVYRGDMGVMVQIIDDIAIAMLHALSFV